MVRVVVKGLYVTRQQGLEQGLSTSGADVRGPLFGNVKYPLSTSSTTCSKAVNGQGAFQTSPERANQ